jgi:hypothetical protein
LTPNFSGEAHPMQFFSSDIFEAITLGIAGPILYLNKKYD